MDLELFPFIINVVIYIVHVIVIFTTLQSLEYAFAFQ